ncbi:uncharacterized protein [Leptinotarsa decemlineata]|uniref:uncharacterized protein n=1 Tax=Leptinotarsa decemlineata TaxID=7539 RepID=UPI000C25469A|nr:uncharacterized protein LOC111509114 [Leptinotarsa decemlineata]
MPFIPTKDRDKIYETITTRLFTHQNNKDHILDSETLKNFSITKSEPSTNMKILSGTAIQNSTIKAGLLKAKETMPDDKLEDEDPNSTTTIITSIKEGSRENDEYKTIIEEKYDRNSIISGSQELQELKSLHKQLRKSSTEPKEPLFEPRRPTLEAIREAIDKVKQMEINRHKNVGTDDDEASSFLVSDASTSTESRKRKPKKKKTNSTPSSTGSNVSPRKPLKKTKKEKNVSKPK